MDVNPSSRDRPTGDLQADFELRHRLLEENLNMGTFLLSAGNGSSIRSSNRVLAAMLGYDCPGDLTGKPFRDLVIHSRDGEDFAAAVMAQGGCRGSELLMRRRDGSEVWVSVRAWGLGTPGSPGSLIEGVAEDITEHKVFEQEVRYHESELNRFAQDLSHANKKLHILSTITRHDILNKLTGMQGYLELMKLEYPDPRIQEYIAVQETIMDTISRQIQFTREYQDIGIRNPRWFDIRDTVHRAAACLALDRVQVTISINDLWVYADPMLEKVFYNLLENALRHGEKLTCLSCTVTFSGEGAHIIVEDDGIGVPEQYKEAIFLRKHFRNTGFGLYLSREILGITGLRIRETGVPGSSARFEITVPPDKYRTGPAAPES